MNAALDLFVKHGFGGTPTSRIASEAGIAHGTIFHYYKTKDELIISLYEQVRNKGHEYLKVKVKQKDSFENRFKSMFFYSVKWALQNQADFYFRRQFQSSPYFTQPEMETKVRQKSLHRALHIEVLKTKALKPLNPELIGALMLSNIEGTFHYLADMNVKGTEQKAVIEDVAELLWTMLKN